MKIKARGIEETKREIQTKIELMQKAYLDELDHMAMKVVAAIRKSEVSFWNDDSGNLRSSVGYILMYDGVEIGKNFELVNSRGREGMEKGMSFAQQLASSHKKGVALIFVAGMEYAAYVEDLKAKDGQTRVVLAGGRILAKNLFKELNESFERRYRK